MEVKLPFPAEERWQWKNNKWEDWCKKNCKADYSIYRMKTTELTCIFADEKDANWFTLRWA
jgi:hypothetical protein